MLRKLVSSAVCAATLLVATPSHAIIVFDPTNFARSIMEDILHQAPMLATELVEVVNIINTYKTIIENLKSLPTAMRQQAEQELTRMTSVTVNDWGQGWQNYHVATDPNSAGYRPRLDGYMRSAYAHTTMPREFGTVLNDMLANIPEMATATNMRQTEIERNQYESLMDSMRQVALQRQNADKRRVVATQAANQLSQLPEKSELRAIQLQGLLTSLNYQQLEDLNKQLSQQLLNHQRTEAVRLAEREADSKARIDAAARMAKQSTVIPARTQWSRF